MKQFKKILILKWHYIEHECIDLGKINFLTGKNGSGKSTLIDAIQLVLLGETRGNFFNKAANEKSLRTLSSYVRGELSDNDSGFEYLRNDDFSSMIAMEVYDTIKKKTFSIGIHMDVYSDGSLNHKFFIMNTSIPSHHFIREGVVMNLGEFKQWGHSEDIGFEQFPSNKRYREVLLAKLGNVNHKFFSLFKKAVTFSPITNIKGFITEFICDTDKKVDIKDMKDNIRYYEKMKLEAEDIEKRLESLTKIHDTFNEYTQLLNIEHVQKFILAKGREQMSEDYIKRLNHNLKAFKKELEETRLSIKIKEEAVKKYSEEINNLNRELAKSDAVELKKKYQKEIDILKNKIDKISQIKENIFLKLRIRSEAWEELDEASTKEMAALKALNQIFKLEEVKSLRLDEVKRINGLMEEKQGNWQQKHYEISKEMETIFEQKKKIQAEIEELKKGNKSIPKGAMKLQKILKNSFKNIPMLCDLMEIKNKKWQNAIEGYLHFQKFYLVIDPINYEKALAIYEKEKKKENIFDVGLIDLKKAKENHKMPQQGSLAEEIETDNEYVRCYIDYLLGSVMKAEHVENLRKYHTAITPTCMLYKGYVARNLNPARYEIPFIGKEAVARQLVIKESTLQEITKSYKEKEEMEAKLKKCTELKTWGEDLIEQLEDQLGDFKRLPEFNKEKTRLIDQLGAVDMSSVFELEFKVQELTKTKISEENELIDKKAKEKNFIEKIKQNETVELPRALKNHDFLSEVIEKNFEETFVSNVGLKRYSGALKRLNTPSEIVKNYDSAAKGAESKRKNKWQDVLSVRSEYTRIYRATYDIQSLSNDQYDALKEKLETTELPAYKDKINRSIQLAQQEFRDDFLSKLKYNIDVVKEQINELNGALKNMNFGKDTYSFKMTPNTYYKRYYDMIMDPNLMAEFNIFSFHFQEKHGPVIEELFKKIVDVGEGAISADERIEIEANISKYTDYRTYLDFDLVVTDMRGNRSHLSKMISKKSGGETQTPFYISVLASFFRVYRMNTKSKDTARLIVFDEAFSKMDHERIEQCVNLLKELEFQALISAPSEKVANITPLVDKTLCVLRTKDETVIRGFTKEELLYEQ